MSYTFLMVTSLVTATLGAAQPAALPPDTPRVVSADTIRAIHRLYRGRRGRGLAIGAGGVGAAGLATTIWNQLDPPRRVGGSIAPDLSGAGHLFFAGLGAVTPVVIGCAISVNFSPQEERNLIRSYEAGQPLPARIRRRLQPRYFKP